MRHGTPNRRPRNHKGAHQSNNQGGQQGGARRGAYNRNQIFDSNGPDVRIRGTAHQVCEKYLALAKDATSIGDIVLAESYLQHAEHYQRIINSWAEEFQSAPRPQGAYTPSEPTSVESDLSLPISILGGDLKQISEQSVRHGNFQKENVLETA